MDGRDVRHDNPDSLHGIQEGSDSHDEGIRWLTLAAASGQNYQAKLVCLQRAVTYLSHASRRLHGTPRYAKSLRNLGMAHWLTAQTTELSSTITPLLSIGEMYKEAIKYYGGFLAERVHHLAEFESEYEQCLGEALALCERLPPKEAVNTIESYLGVIPARQGSYRYKCLLKMSDILEYHAKMSTSTGPWLQEGRDAVHADPEQLEQFLSDHGTPPIMNTDNKPGKDETDHVCSLNDPDLSPMQTIHVLRSYQDPAHSRHTLADPETLKPLGLLTELGRAKYYFSTNRVRGWIKRTRPPGVHDDILNAITRALHKYRTLDVAHACLESIQQLHSHSAYQLLGTLHSVYNIMTPYSPGYSLPSVELKTLTRVQYALDKAIRCVESDMRRDEEADDGELQQIMKIMVTVLKQADADFREIIKLDKASSTPEALLGRLQEIWEPFQYLLPPYTSASPLSVLLAARAALDMAINHDKDNFCLVLRKRLAIFQSESAVYDCITQILHENKNQPIRILSVLYRAYPPSDTWQYSATEEALQQLSPKEIRHQIDSALKAYMEANVKHIHDEVKPILLQIREQLNRPKPL